MRSIIRKIGDKLAYWSGYPSTARFFINKSPFNTNIYAGENVDISSRTSFKGSIEIGDGVHIFPDSRLEGDIQIEEGARIFSGSKVSGEVTIGLCTNLGPESDVQGNVSFGKYNAVGPEVVFQGRNHFMHKPSIQATFHSDRFEEPIGHTTDGGIRIGHDVWIGRRAIILPGVKIGHGAVIGAGAVVTTDVEPYEIVAGVPAVHKNWRFTESTRKSLLEIAWWEWDEDKIKRNDKFFTSSLANESGLDDMIK